MKRMLLCLVLSLSSPYVLGAQNTIRQTALEIKADHQAHKMKVLLGVVTASEQLESIATIIQQDLQLPLEKRSGFDVTVRSMHKEPRTKNQIKKLFDEGYSLAVFISAGSGTEVMYRLYDVTQAVMVQGKRVATKQMSHQAIGHYVAGQLMANLVGRPLLFGSQLAYCKEVSSGKHHKHVYVADPHLPDTQAKLLDSSSSKCGLRWHTHDGRTRLYYSEQSAVNVRLLAYDIDNKRSKLIMNFDGLNMQPSFNKEGNKVVVCCSQAGSSQLYIGTLDAQRKQWSFKRLTHNRGNNISPYWCNNDDIIFCSDYKTRSPQLYRYCQDTNAIECLTTGGYCACPAVNEQQGYIAYVKLVGNYSQLYLYNMQTKKHTQLTSDSSYKDEPTWSPCGSYLAYSVEQKDNSRIAVRNIVSQESYFITTHNEHCSNPAWGPGVVA